MEGVLQPTVRGESKLAHNIINNMVNGLNGKEHVVVMDNCFSHVGIFIEIASRGIYTIDTMNSNRVGITKEFKDTKSFNGMAMQGGLERHMHINHSIGSILWKDMQPVLLILTHAQLIGFPCKLVDVVPFEEIFICHQGIRNTQHTCVVFKLPINSKLHKIFKFAAASGITTISICFWI
jgi:hypothetical protein